MVSAPEFDIWYYDEPFPEQPEPEPTIEDLCAAQGHPWHGYDAVGLRCYCGEVRQFPELEVIAG